MPDVDAETHNKYLAYGHFAYAGIQTLFALLICGFMAAIFATAPSGPSGPPPAFFGFIFLFVFFVQVIFALPSALAGYALLKRKSWAKIAAIVAGALAGMSVPLGTALCIYTFWFLFGDMGKQLYDQDARPAMRPVASLFGHPESTASPRAGERSYAPPYEPPDWRD